MKINSPAFLAEYSSNGGSAYNVIKALFKLEGQFPLEAIGLVGDDERGASIIQDCEKMGVHTAQMKQTSRANTSYTDVMSVKSTGNRTFFHHRGANAFLDVVDFDFGETAAKIFHLGYLLLLDKLDLVDETGWSGAAKVLKEAQSAGLITSVDIVSENSSRFRSVIPSALPFVDYLFVNEYEAQMLSDIITVNERGLIDIEQCKKAATNLIEMGVKQWVIVHFPEGAIAVNHKGECRFQDGIDLPSKKIAGAVGAGDAFAAGVLMGIHENWSMEKSLQLGVCAAASCLFEPTCSDGILTANACLLLPKMYGFKSDDFIT